MANVSKLWVMQGGADANDEGYVVPALLKFSGHPEVSGTCLSVLQGCNASMHVN
jgi:hypothetical protein